MDEVLLIRRHPRNPLWRRYSFSAYEATPEERKFEVLRPNGTSLGEITFNEFSDRWTEATTPWGNFEIRGARLSSKLSIGRTGLKIADVSFNLLKTEVRLVMSDGSEVTMRTRLSDFGYICRTASDEIRVGFEGAFTQDGISIKDLPSRQVRMEWAAKKAPDHGYFQKPADKDERRTTAPDPFYAQWRMTMPSAGRGRDSLIAVVAVLTCMRWLKVMETPRS